MVRVRSRVTLPGLGTCHLPPVLFPPLSIVNINASKRRHGAERINGGISLSF